MSPVTRPNGGKTSRQRTGATLLLAAACALKLTAAQAGDLTLQGDRLALTVSGGTNVTIETQPGLSNAVRMTGDDLSCLKTQTSQVVEIDTDGCGDDVGDLKLLVPPGYPITVASEGSGDVHIDDVGGPLNATLAASGNLIAGRTKDLMLAVHGNGDATVALVEGAADLRIGGSGDVKVAHVQGILHAATSGSGDISIGSIAAPAADISIEGSGDVSIGDGYISALRAQANGSGDLNVVATVVAADLRASGGSDMKLKDVTGVVKRNASDGSDIVVGGNGKDADKLRQMGDLNVQGLDQLKELKQLDALKGMTINLSDGQWHSTHTSSHSGFGHFVAGVIVLGLLYFGWRTIQRSGGWNAMRNRAGTPSAPTHPGVMAVRDTLARLDGRLAQVESYVTTREFDLHRKFRDLDK